MIKNTQKGFTLIELLVVIAIIGILAGILFIAINPKEQSDKANRAIIANDFKQIEKALSFYSLDNEGYPCHDHSWDDAKEKNWSKPYINWPTNPWGNQYHLEHGFGNFTYSISTNLPSPTEAQNLDNYMDDGNLSTGSILLRGGSRIEYGLSQQIPLVNCHI